MSFFCARVASFFGASFLAGALASLIAALASAFSVASALAAAALLSLTDFLISAVAHFYTNDAASAALASAVNFLATLAVFSAFEPA